MTTAFLEHLSTLSVSLQQLRRLPEALRGSRLAALPCTLTETDVPLLFREPYIHAGYRPVGQEWRYYFLSLFQQHNEALNVWTHLLAALVVLLRLWAFAGAEGLACEVYSAPLLIFILASLTYLTCSVLAHLLQSKSEMAHYSFYFLDYVGVSVYQYGSAMAHFYYSADQAWHNRVWPFFLPGAAFLGWLTCVGCCYAKYRYRRPYPVMRKICQVVPAGLAYALDISPIAHRVISCHAAGCSDEAVWYHTCQILFFLAGAYFFSCPVPERFFPGRCDIVGHGHQLFHVLLALCTLSQLEAVFLDYRNRRQAFTARHRPDAVWLGCVSFVVLVLCSAAAALCLQRRIKERLRTKAS
ncbi:membrane progestin receptor beta [Latimeria chalumnae]|nr:PREDICTED: membrane progestin receptor beta [Latimeria chalumnae]|eukprot:XP_006009425.1 PREDICTED: membrane progestin receptor beta [Latimeria chalumnae]